MVHVVLNIWVVVVPVGIVVLDIEMTVWDSMSESFVEDMFEWSVLILDKVSKRFRGKVGW